MHDLIIVYFRRFAEHEKDYMFPKLKEERPWAFREDLFPSSPFLYEPNISEDLSKAKKLKILQ